jgi:hypothetical protein
MLAGWLLASLLAQAEPAPPEAPPPPLPGQPDPNAVPDPALLGANIVSVHASLAYRLDSGGSDATLGPAGGFSVGGEFERRYYKLSGIIELGAALDFSYQRFATGVQGVGTTVPGEDVPFDGQRVLSKTGFALLQTVAVRAARWRPFVAVGPGVVINFFSSPELALRPGSTTVVQPTAQVTAGLGVDVGQNMAFVARLDVVHPLTEPVFEPTMSPQSPAPRFALFGDVIAVGCGLAVRF